MIRTISQIEDEEYVQILEMKSSKLFNEKVKLCAQILVLNYEITNTTLKEFFISVIISYLIFMFVCILGGKSMMPWIS